MNARGDAAGGATAREALAFVDKLVCFRFAERMANESPHRQDDVRPGRSVGTYVRLRRYLRSLWSLRPYVRSHW